MIRVVTCQTLKGIDFVLCIGHLARSRLRFEWFFCLLARSKHNRLDSSVVVVVVILMINI